MGCGSLRPATATHRQWRLRKASFGEMVQTATSEHDWFEGQGERAVLITLIDDATSRVTMRFFEADDTHVDMMLLRDYITLYGRPMAFHGDRASRSLVNRQVGMEEQSEAPEPETRRWLQRHHRVARVTPSSHASSSPSRRASWMLSGMPAVPRRWLISHMRTLTVVGLMWRIPAISLRSFPSA